MKRLNEIGLFPKYHQLDIENESSIKAFHDHLSLTHGRIDILVNNAGIMFHVKIIFF